MLGASEKKKKKKKYYIILLYSLFGFFFSDAPSPCVITLYIARMLIHSHTVMYALSIYFIKLP